ncbi:MAG TPA: nucleotidyltransferase substrate binding protein [Bacillales bacterium]|nr:nucleotidyltransferase substrate binding protein [Bacillales bacterium]
MERLNKKLKSADMALSAFLEALDLEKPNSFERDAAILRFNFTFEAVWKTAKEILFEIDGIDVNSPKAVIHSCRQVGIFDEKETKLALSMANDRNLSVRTYYEELSLQISSRLITYKPIFLEWVRQLKDRVEYEH